MKKIWGILKETDSELIISLMLSVREPLCFPENANGGKQVLDLLDSSGRKGGSGYVRCGTIISTTEKRNYLYVHYRNFEGGPGAGYLLAAFERGIEDTLARLQESPVYELAFQPGAQMDVLRLAGIRRKRREMATLS